jgi:hypothetical protein
MNAAFISLDSRVTIKNGWITVKKFKTDTEEGFTRFIAFVALLALLAFCLYRIIEDKAYFFTVQLLLVLIWLAPHIKRIYTFLFVITWKSAIRMDDIRQVTTLPLENGLETRVTLHLVNGRKKFLTFRDAENQLPHFIRSIGIKGVIQHA